MYTKNGNGNDHAVSPVVGVILMVAITMILAAIVAAYVFGVAGEQKQAHFAGFTAERTFGDNVNVVYATNGGSATQVTSIDVYIGDTKYTYANPKVGAQWTYTAIPKNTRVRAVASYDDGTAYPSLDKTV